MPPPAMTGPNVEVRGFCLGGGNSKISWIEAIKRKRDTNPCKVLLSILPAVSPPKADPTQILGATILINFQLTTPLLLCEKVEEIELKTITPSELPSTM